MQIAVNRQDFRALFMLPRELQYKSVFLWQLAEVAWRKPHALEVLEHLWYLSHAVVHVYVVAAGRKGLTVAAHAVYETDGTEQDSPDPWQAIVDGSYSWAQDFVANFEFPADEPYRANPPLFDFWAYNEVDYRRLRGSVR